MASFRESRFRSSRRAQLGEDVNPSAYIVNLADCMLVLACGFLVALMSYWNIDVRTMEELESSDLEEVEPQEMPAEIMGDGSYYVEAGKVYRDPATGTLYLLAPEQEMEEVAGASASGATGATGVDQGLGLADDATSAAEADEAGGDENAAGASEGQ